MEKQQRDVPATGRRLSHSPTCQVKAGWAGQAGQGTHVTLTGRVRGRELPASPATTEIAQLLLWLGTDWGRINEMLLEMNPVLKDRRAV